MQYFHLAFQNVKKSFKDYFIYFLTLTFSICLFYTFNSFQAQQEIMELSESQSTIMSTVSIFMTMLSVFVAIVLAFLVMYANNFLVRRRKKEFGLYMLLGMPQRQISRVLIYETVTIGCISLVSGIALGILCSQGLGLLTAHLFVAKVNYHIVFSLSACLMTVISFTVIFLVIMLFNTRVIAKVKLIELLRADKLVEKQRLMRPVMSLLVFILSIGCILTAYKLATTSLTVFASMLVPILILGSVGTLLFFFSLSGFLLQFIRKSKILYFKNLNMFILRQIHAKINTNFVSMSIVCLMLLLSIGALATGWNMNNSINKSMEILAPYSYSYEQTEKISADEMKNQLMLGDKEYRQLPIYEDDHKVKELYPYLSTEAKDTFYAEGQLQYIRYSDYVNVMKDLNRKPVTLKEGECFAISGNDKINTYLQDITSAKITVFDHALTLKSRDHEVLNMVTAYSSPNIISIIVSDSLIPNSVQPVETFWNVNMSENQVAAYQTTVQKRLETYAQEQNIDYVYSGVTKKDIMENSIGMGLLFTYIGLYLGIVFLMASAAILAIQQLSEAEDNKKRYEILGKIGTSSRMMDGAIRRQIGIYFLLPLMLAILHSIVGVKVVAGSFETIFGLGDMTFANLMTGGIILVIYGSYYLVTYQGYRNILNHR